MSEAGTCSSCGVPILWVYTAASRALMPLNPEPCAEGNIILKDDLAYVIGATLFDSLSEADKALPSYQSHFVSCPCAARQRRKKPHG